MGAWYSPDELKFVVDAAAPFAELEWAQQMVDLPLRELGRAYAMIRYRMDRIANNQPIWLGRTSNAHELSNFQA